MNPTYIKLGDVVSVHYGKGLPQESRSDDGKYFAYGSNGAVGRTDTKLIENPTIIIGRKGAAGALYLTQEPSWAIDTTFYLEKKDVDVNFEFLYYQLQIKELSKLAITTAMPGLNRSTLENVKVIIPPITIQNTIAQRISTVRETAKLNAELIERTDELLLSLLSTDLSPKSKGWTTRKLGDVIEIVSGFGFPTTIQGRKNELIPFYKVSDMNLKGNETEMIFHNNSISLADVKKYGYKLMPAGTIIFPKIGAAIATNKKRILTRDSVYDNNVVGFVSSDAILSSYLFFWLLNFDISEWASESDPPSIRKSVIEEYEIFLPSREEQEKIVTKLSVVQDYRKHLIEQKVKLEELFMAVLTRSFTDKLADVPEEVKINKFALQQAIAAILQQFERGEMVIAKVLYIAQEIYQVPLGFRFAAHNFGPYDTEIKRSLMAGMSTYNQFFTRKGTGAYALGVNAGKLFKYQSKTLGSMKAVLKDLLPYIKNADSSAIECLATVCKIMQDNKTDDLEVIKQKMIEWKKDRFSAAQVKGAYDFIISKGWDKKLTI